MAQTWTQSSENCSGLALIWKSTLHIIRPPQAVPLLALKIFAHIGAKDHVSLPSGNNHVQPVPLGTPSRPGPGLICFKPPDASLHCAFCCSGQQYALRKNLPSAQSHDHEDWKRIIYPEAVTKLMFSNSFVTSQDDLGARYLHCSAKIRDAFYDYELYSGP